ncbi:MAG: AAA family ATPase [Candidatus Omnitrophica bacterium]|nr:AAA family ATPase [Candidatus Omnitrophota bacterium]
MNFDKIEKNAQFLRAYELFEHSRKNIFLTGRAGTGKSTLLQYFRSSTSKNVVVLAPTGVAAVNIKGQTIHSFFNFRPDTTPAGVEDIRLRRAQREIYKNLDTIIVDEISMVRADLFDCMDAFLRLHGPHKDEPFGGVQMILIGDLYQLPPVVTGAEREIFQGVYPSPYFFDAKAFPELGVEYLELETIYRQKEDQFIRLLNAVRDNDIRPEELALLNKRLDPAFTPPAGEFFVYLTTTNSLADEINKVRISSLKGKLHQYPGDVSGKFEEKNLPTQEMLEVKIGAQVMLLNNDQLGRWVNGTIGQVTDIIHADSGDAIRVRLAEGQTVDVAPFTWEMYRFFYDKEAAKVSSEVTGAFTQYPLRLAWAVTIHKSQGKTFSRVIIDVGRGTFSHGQIYVALSRCTSLDGIILKKPILKHHIMMDVRVRHFLEKFKKIVHKQHLVLE